MNSALRLALSTLAFSFVSVISHAQATPPSTPAVSASVTNPAIDPHAMELLKQNQDAMLLLNSYQAECRTTITRDVLLPNKPAAQYELAILRATKPNLMRYDSWELPDPAGQVNWTLPTVTPTYTFACNGKDNFQQFGTVYTKDTRVAPDQLATILEPWIGFYAAASSIYGTAKEFAAKNELSEARVLGADSVDNVPCDRVYLHILTTYNGQKVDERDTWYLGADHLARRCASHITFGDRPGVTCDAVLYTIKLDDTIDPKIYAYTAPPGVTLKKDMPPVPLLANGVVAPEFTAVAADGRAVKLSDYRGKVVIVDFWASWCGPCMAAMPHNQDVVSKLQKSGLAVVLLAVDDDEERSAFDLWTAAKSGNYAALLFVYVDPKTELSNKLYKITYIPTQYVIDKQGVIRASIDGIGGPPDELEKAVTAALNSH